MDLIIAVPIAMILGYATAHIAQSKGYNFTLWFLFGFLMFCIAFPAILLQPDLKKKEEEDAEFIERNFRRSGASGPTEDVERMPCDQCGEMIPVTAKICRYCGLRIANPEQESVSDESIAPLSEQERKDLESQYKDKRTKDGPKFWGPA